MMNNGVGSSGSGSGSGSSSGGLSTPVMNAIQEEETPEQSGISSEYKEFNTPLAAGNVDTDTIERFTLEGNDYTPTAASNLTSNGVARSDSRSRRFLTSPTQQFSRPSSGLFYSAKDSNNSSSSLIYNPSFTFGVNSPSVTTKNASNGTLSPKKNNNAKYMPSFQSGPPTSRNRSPVRLAPPPNVTDIHHDNAKSKRSSLAPDAPLNFSSIQNTPAPSASRASFRKGHRYKHSSVSMNFFQEPEVKIPLNIAKSLPIPNIRDLINNLPWPKAYLQMCITLCQCLMCIFIFQLGHSKSWSNFLTLSHFITYDIVGSMAIILVENLSQFEVWSIGTITFPFGLNRIDVLLSFGLAVSLCFVGLDLLFHLLEELVVLFVESDTEHEHDQIATNIPHSHQSPISITDLDHASLQIWYMILFVNLLLSVSSLYKVFYANKHSKLKTKNPIITIIYTFYLLMYPLLPSTVSSMADYVAAFALASFILLHGLTIVKWTATILLMGLSTTALSTPTNALLTDEEESISSLSRNIALEDDTYVLKSLLEERIESLSEFKSRCSLNHNDLLVAKVNFNLFIVLAKISMKGGSNDHELMLRVAVDRCIKELLPTAETTIEIDRI